MGRIWMIAIRPAPECRLTSSLGVADPVRRYGPFAGAWSSTARRTWFALAKRAPGYVSLGFPDPMTP
jgi:hypothetical protein